MEGVVEISSDEASSPRSTGNSDVDERGADSAAASSAPHQLEQDTDGALGYSQRDTADALAWWNAPLHWTIDHAPAIECKPIIGVHQSPNLMDDIGDNHKSHVTRGASKFATDADVRLLMSSQPSPTTTMAFAKTLAAETSVAPATLVALPSLVTEAMQIEGPLVCTRRFDTTKLNLSASDRPGRDSLAAREAVTSSSSAAGRLYKPYLNATISQTIHPDELVVPPNDADLSHVVPALAHSAQHLGSTMRQRPLNGCHLLAPPQSFCQSQHLPDAELLFERWSSPAFEGSANSAASLQAVMDYTKRFHSSAPGDFGFIRSNLFCPEPFGLSASGLSQEPFVTLRDGAKVTTDFGSDDFVARDDHRRGDEADDGEDGDDACSECDPSLLVCRNGHVTCSCCLLVHWIKQALEQTRALQFAKLGCPSCDALFSVNKFWRFIYAPRTVTTLLTLIHHVTGDYTGGAAGGTPLTHSMASDIWPSSFAEVHHDDEFTYHPESVGARMAAGVTSTGSWDMPQVPSGRVFSWFMWRWFPLVYHTKRQWRRYLRRPDSFMWCDNGLPAFVATSAHGGSDDDDDDDAGIRSVGWWRVPGAASSSKEASIGFGECRRVTDLAEALFELVPLSGDAKKCDALLSTMLASAADARDALRDWMSKIVSSFTTRWRRSRPSSASLANADSAYDHLELFCLLSVSSIGIGDEKDGGDWSESTALLYATLSEWRLRKDRCAIFDMASSADVPVVDLAPGAVPTFGIDARQLLPLVRARARSLWVLAARQASLLHAMRTFGNGCPCCGWLPSRTIHIDAGSLVRCGACLLHFSVGSNDVYLFRSGDSLASSLTSLLQTVRAAEELAPSGLDISHAWDAMIASYQSHCTRLNCHCDDSAVRFDLFPPEEGTALNRRVTFLQCFERACCYRVISGLMNFRHYHLHRGARHGAPVSTTTTTTSSSQQDDYVVSALCNWQASFSSRLLDMSSACGTLDATE